MRYELGADGYVTAVAFGSYLKNCQEYNGEVPSGYKNLDDWATYSCITAYYIDPKGNLTLDYARKTEIENRAEQEAIANTPVLRKDIFDTEEALAGQYVRQIASGNVIVLEDIKTVAPKLKITGIKPGYSKLSIHTNGKNMLPCDAVSNVISGVTFTKNASGSMTVLGTATENIDYVIADGKDTTIFALKSNCDYFLNLGGLNCELKYYDGETTAQQYIGASGLINLPEHIEVTQVIIKIASGDSVNTTFYPQLEVGNAFTRYETHKLRTLDIEFPEIKNKQIIPSDTLYAEDTLYPGMREETIEYILIENGTIIAYVGGKRIVVSNGGVGLFNCSTVYATKDVELEIEYSANFLLVDSLAFLQGKATTTNRFKILDDGSIEAHNGYFSGKIEATSGYFSGSISASSISGGTISGSSISGGTISGTIISGNTISGGTISGGSISGGTISGSSISGGTISIGVNFEVDWLGNVKAHSLSSSYAEISGGKIGGFDIKTTGICKGKSSINDGSSGVYIGTDGINIGYNNAFKVTDQGDVTLGSIGGLTLAQSAEIGFIGGSISVEYNGVYLGYDRATHLTSGELRIGGTYNYYTTITPNKIAFGSSTSNSVEINKGDYLAMTISNDRVIIPNAIVGGANGKISFFGKPLSSQKTVSTISSSASTSSVASKLNDLINALKTYGLIG